MSHIFCNVKIKLATKDVVVPKYATFGAAGMDVCAYIPDGEKVMVLDSKQVRLVPTGIFMEIPDGFECQVRSRSGLSTKGITVANSPGTVDSDFRGEVKVILRNDSHATYVVHHGDRIAQLVFAPVAKANFKIVDGLNDTQRGHGGFGSSGR